MSISLCTLAPFGVKLPGLRLRCQARSSLRVKDAAATGGENGLEKTMEQRDLDVLYDDGFGRVTLKDYLTTVGAMLRNDGGPPRWFCPVECGQPKELMVLEWSSFCTISHWARLLKFVEQCVKYEHFLKPNRPIYIIGDSFGGCLAISLAARNPEVDLVLVLVDPGVSCAETSLQPILLPILQIVPTILRLSIPYLAISEGIGTYHKMGYNYVEVQASEIRFILCQLSSS